MDRTRVQDILVKLETDCDLLYRSKAVGVFRMFESIIEQLCPPSRDIFLKEPTLLHLQPPITIAGNFYDVHSKLESILQDGGHPHRNSKYLFLGDYIENRQDYLRTILRLLAFKNKDPQSVYLLKGGLNAFGNKPIQVDELDDMNVIGINSTSMQMLEDCLASLPIAAVISGKIICTHGGLHNLNQIMRIQRPINLSDSPLLDDLIGTYSRRYSDETEFLEKHDLHLVCCRNNQVASKKKYFAERRVVSVGSASAKPMYYKMIHNSAENTNVILMRVKADLKCSIRNLRYKEKSWSYHIPKKAVTKVGASESVTSNPSPIRFDPANMYRSKGKSSISTVKGFIGGANLETKIRFLWPSCGNPSGSQACLGQGIQESLS